MIEKLNSAIALLEEVARQLPEHNDNAEEAYWCLRGAINDANEAAGYIETLVQS